MIRIIIMKKKNIRKKKIAEEMKSVSTLEVKEVESRTLRI
jgi:hypothetical protein